MGMCRHFVSRIASRPPSRASGRTLCGTSNPSHERGFDSKPCGASRTRNKNLERAMGIEPTLVAWEATVLPLNYARTESKV